MNETIGWHFPPTNGGMGAGFNDPGIAHFTGAPLASLARETIQNSLDARLASGNPVRVDFELISLNPEIVGRDELANAITACLQIAKESNDTIAIAPLEEASRTINSKAIHCLRVSDRNTTGLLGDHWRNLVKMQGVSYKPELEGQGAGGSHGIGKYAPFAVSALRSVFYWTYFSEDGKNQERFQGKSVLMSHCGADGEETQGTGFYGFKKDCRELTGQELTEQIPAQFRVFNLARLPQQGTSLTILGFRETDNWRKRIATSVIENFFFAIGTGSLTVIVEPDDSSDLMELERDTIDKWFQHLMDDEDPGDSEAAADNPLRDAQIFWELSKGEPIAEKQDGDLGHCKLWLRTDVGLPGKVAFVRGTGMLVTTRQKGLIRFSGFRDFAALCVFEDPEGNELLRRMENPQHDQFEPDRLPKEKRERGRKALKRVTDWVRSEIKKHAGPPEGGKRTVISELSQYLPDYQPEESFDDSNSDKDEGNSEPGFGDKVAVSLKPVRRPVPPRLPGNDGSNSEGDGEDLGNEGGAGTGNNGGGEGDGGQGEGGGQGGTGTRGGSSNKQSVPVSAVRILPIAERENCCRLSFLAEADGIVRLNLAEAGDSSSIPRNDVRAISSKISLDRMRVKNGQRIEVEITADEPIDGRAWRLSATPVQERNES